MPQAPRLIRWILSLAIFFLVAMTLLRVGAYLVFKHEPMSWVQVFPAFWLGWRYDARVVATAMFVLLSLGGWPGIGAFRGTLGRRGWLILLGVFSGALIVFYVCDFLHYRYLSQRLNASALSFLADAKISAAMVWQTYPVVRLVLGIGLALAGCVAVMTWLHRRAAAAAEPARRSVRVAWFVAVAAACVVGIFGRVGQYPLRWSDAFDLRNDFIAHLELNPV